jgi:hypothetical protein
MQLIRLKKRPWLSATWYMTAGEIGASTVTRKGADIESVKCVALTGRHSQCRRDKRKVYSCTWQAEKK